MDMKSLLVGVVITAVAYMVVPLLCLFINGKMEEKKAKKLALWNSIVLGAIFLILTASADGIWNAAPAYLYYLINKRILTDKFLASENKKIEDVARNSEMVKTGEASSKLGNEDKIIDNNNKVTHICISAADDIPERKSGLIYREDVCLQIEDDQLLNHMIAQNKDGETKLPKVRFCRKCGNRIEEKARFCSNCGTEVIRG